MLSPKIETDAAFSVHRVLPLRPCEARTLPSYTPLVTRCRTPPGCGMCAHGHRRLPVALRRDPVLSILGLARVPTRSPLSSSSKYSSATAPLAVLLLQCSQGVQQACLQCERSLGGLPAIHCSRWNNKL